MNLTDKTLTILKNFAGINNSILVKQGNQLRTISVAKNILAEANIEEEFPRQFGVYDLNQFLNGLSLHQDPDLDFTEESYLNILYFKVERELLISFTNYNSKFVRSIILLITNYKFNNTCFTNC